MCIRKGIMGGLALAVLFMVGCSKDHDMDAVSNPRDPSQGAFAPPIPTDVEAQVGNRQVALTWSVEEPDPDSGVSIAKFRLYRREAGGSPVRADSSAGTSGLVRSLVNGVNYYLSVASVLDNGLEGFRSEEISATPGAFGVQIAGGSRTTSSAQVVLTLLAPEQTQGVRLANDPELTGAATQPFTTALNWRLAPGDGDKTVYAQFVDQEGNLSQTVSDQIALDTRAEILSIALSPLQAQPGQILSIQLDAGEPFGRASIQLGEGGRILELRDDGLEGDAAAGDGIYSLDYLIEEDVQLVEALVTGRFTDEAGNQAEPRISENRLTIRRDPPAVILDPIRAPGPRELYLTWSQVTDLDRFRSYRVYRSETAGVDTSTTRLLVKENTSSTQTFYTDTNLNPNKTYYYRVYVVDPFGYTTPSNEESGKPRRNDPPDAVVLNTPNNVSEEAVGLSWSQSVSPEFDAYRVYRGEQADIDSDPERRLLTTIRNSTTTTYEDRNDLEENRTYYYRVDVVDDLGAAGPSNVISALIPDLPPTAVNLSTPSSVGETAILLSWSKNSDLDFDRYEVRRSDQAGVGENALLIAAIDDRNVRSHLDTGLVENTEYYYRVFVVDKGGNVTGSNELDTETANEDPTAVSLATLTEEGGALTPTVNLSWSRSEEHDFDQYRIYRDTSPAVGENSTLVRTVADVDVLSYVNSGLTDNTRYYYRIFVRDDAGGSTGSNERSILTENRPPDPVTLSVSSTTETSISLSWTQCPSHDFDEYRLLRGTNSLSFPTTVIAFTQRAQTSHTLHLAEDDSTRYFFKVVTYDKELESSGRLSTDSNVVSGRIRTD